jgi:DNA repair exonuclease SbcCD ATPase subunit
MPKLNIKTLTIQNFRSYGDYQTTIALDGLGPILITGHNEDDPDKMNGVGKSTIAEAIIWVLFGRLPGNKQPQITPGDWVVNEKTGERCICTITTIDGYTIKRTRKYNGHNDLLIIDPSGNDISSATNKTAQEQLTSLFNLDYDIFTSQIFSAQSGQSFLELSDQKRKRALERLLNLNRFDYYAMVAKDRLAIQTQGLIKHDTELERVTGEISRLSEQIESNINGLQEYEDRRQQKISQITGKYAQLDIDYDVKARNISKDIADTKLKLENIKTVDIDNLRKSWSTYEKNIGLFNEVVASLNKLQHSIDILKTERQILENQTSGTIEHTDTEDQIKKAREELSRIPDIDIIKLKAEWELYDKEDDEHDGLEDELNIINQEVKDKETELKLINDNINRWSSMAGQICPECKQKIASEHVKHVSNPDEIKKQKIISIIDGLKIKANDKQKIINAKLKKLDQIRPKYDISQAESFIEQRKTKLETIKLLEDSQKEAEQKAQEILLTESNRQREIQRLDKLIEGKTRVLATKTEVLTRKKVEIESKRPTLTINEAIMLKQQYDETLEYIDKLKKSLSDLDIEKNTARGVITSEIKKAQEEINPYQKIVDDLKIILNTTIEERKIVLKASQEDNKLINHLGYIQKAYSDRRKIRSFVMSKLMPYFNDRIAYYLNALECEYKHTFNSFLQTQSDKWPYELWSGGQRRRVDLAIMLAMHDLHESIYDKQCNILVFDEYDRGLDKSGIYAFVNMLFKEFPNQTILIISHNENLQDMFPNKITIKYSNGLSTVS